MMPLPTVSPPHRPGPPRVETVMLTVLAALLPGIAMSIGLFGWGVLFNLMAAAGTAVLCEALAMRLRGRPAGPAISDRSALLAGVLLGLTLPAMVPWWIPVLGSATAILLAKHLYGGLGQNTFNPAMVGYVVLLISFPLHMTLWPISTDVSQVQLNPGYAFLVFIGGIPGEAPLDAITMATPLDALRTELGRGLTLSELYATPLFGGDATVRSWAILNLAFLAGGLWMIWKRVIDWRIPAGMLGALALCALVFSGYDSDRFPSPLFHLFSGAAMLGAFFIATDPVTAATSPRGRWIYGIGIGVITFVIRSFGGYPDGVAFGVLLMNMAVPTLDYYTQPRVYGQSGSGSGER